MTAVLEMARLDIRPGETAAFEAAFTEARQLIEATPGFVDLEIQRCIEEEQRYLLLVRWESLEAHTQGFRGSDRYERWRELLHHFYDPFPVVEHYSSLGEAE